MIKQILILSLTLISFSSCALYFSQMSTDDRMKKLQIGMTRQEVVSIVGNHYEITSNNEEGCVLAYKSLTDNGIYFLYFENNRLKEWVKEWLHNCSHPSPPPPLNSHN